MKRQFAALNLTYTSPSPHRWTFHVSRCRFLQQLLRIRRRHPVRPRLEAPVCPQVLIRRLADLRFQQRDDACGVGDWIGTRKLCQRRVHAQAVTITRRLARDPHAQHRRTRQAGDATGHRQGCRRLAEEGHESHVQVEVLVRRIANRMALAQRAQQIAEVLLLQRALAKGAAPLVDDGLDGRIVVPPHHLVHRPAQSLAEQAPAEFDHGEVAVQAQRTLARRQRLFQMFDAVDRDDAGGDAARRKPGHAGLEQAHRRRAQVAADHTSLGGRVQIRKTQRDVRRDDRPTLAGGGCQGPRADMGDGHLPAVGQPRDRARQRKQQAPADAECLSGDFGVGLHKPWRT
ncbi:MAG: hypothetical protein IPO66_22285 [Rhodanobacteraceae bacterium]|nr:hypothetical protein [Rhodanobacteraceae bacterium]